MTFFWFKLQCFSLSLKTYYYTSYLALHFEKYSSKPCPDNSNGMLITVIRRQRGGLCVSNKLNLLPISSILDYRSPLDSLDSGWP